MGASSKAPRRNWLLWGIRKAGLVALGVLIYCTCINMFAGYTTSTVAWVMIAAVSALAGFFWIRDERRGRDE